MFKTIVGALGGEEDAAFLRPETAQGIFVNFKNVCDSTRVKVPFGIAQIGKSFRNEITPRNFTFRSREFEQMEIEFFCHPQCVAQVVRVLARSPDEVVHRSRPVERTLAAARASAGRTEPLLDAARPTSNTRSRSCPPASSANSKGSPIAAISTCAATWKASSIPNAKPDLEVELGPDGKPK